MKLAKSIIIIGLLIPVYLLGQNKQGDCTLRKDSVKDRVQRDDLVHFPNPARSSLSMNILFKTFSGLDVVDGSEIACFTPDNILAGATALDPDDADMGWGLAVWGDEGMTDEVEGFISGEEIRLLFWDPVHKWELDVSVEFRQGDELVYHTNDFIVVDATLDVKDDEPVTRPFEFGLNSVYPNPFNSTTVINFTLAETQIIDLGIYDLAGRKIKSLLKGEFNTGKHLTILNGTDLQSGIYLIVLESAETKAVERVVLIK
ncbi:T9SS type A sorting domain-containing protein [bacterium]|nr:T9SS type A sorting domain-containing protein [bacterium]